MTNPNEAYGSIEKSRFRVYELNAEGLPGEERTVHPVPAKHIIAFLTTIKEVNERNYLLSSTATRNDSDSFREELERVLNKG